MSNTWNFPNNGCGLVRGIADAGIETFSGTEIQSLAREICQNSLDAQDEDASENVHVEFERYVIDSEDIPGYEVFASNLRRALTYWSQKKSEKAIAFLDKAVKTVELKKTFVLRISDYNTTGLLDPYGDSDEGWNALTKIDGGATKSGDKAGAFGIGKNAPFCNSDYRLVFYRTLNNEGEFAAQGVSRLISFPVDENDSFHTMTAGIGFYGNEYGNMPVPTIMALDRIHQRDEIGTDVFVYGFNGRNSWSDDVACEILENFLMAIYKGKLAVSIGQQKIDKASLEQKISRYQSTAKQAYCFYQVLTRQDTKIFTRDFHGMGTLKLSILADQNEKIK